MFLDQNLKMAGMSVQIGHRLQEKGMLNANTVQPTT